MHDEFSAILRTYYDNFSDLIEIGVKQNDSHPAGIQIFIYYWIKIFGLSEASLKFPFIIMGTASVYATYLVGKQWFGKTSAILSAVVMAVIQFGIFYSQLARPYGPGLCFVLLSTYFWTELVFKQKTKTITVIAYILTASMASYIHAFSLFFVFVQGISGIFYLRQRKLTNYIFFNLLVFLLYIPHINIFLAQIGRGDIGGWLGEPDSLFLIDFVNYIFHFSWIFLFCIATIIIILIFLSPNKQKGINKFRVISLSWFMLTYLIAHLYSIFRSPILQYSTLLFVFPYLLMLVFSFIGEIKISLKYLVVVLISLIGVFTLISDRQHYKLMYTQGFDGIALNAAKDIDSFKNNNTAIVMQGTEHRMLDYYFTKNDLGTEYYRLSEENSISEINKYLTKKNNETLIYGWVDYARLEYLAYFKDRYKYTIREKQFFNSEYYLFSNTYKEGSTVNENKHLIDKIPELEQQILYKSHKPGYSRSIDLNMDSLSLDKYDVLNIRAKVNYSQNENDILLVFDMKDKEGNVISWSASNFNKYYSDEDSSGYYVYHSKRLMSLYPLSEGSKLKTYIWKRDTTLVEVKSIEVYITKLNPIETGLYDKIPSGFSFK